MEMSSSFRDSSTTLQHAQDHLQSENNQLMNNTNSPSMFSGELQLPPGFRFHPTDEELVVHYLTRKLTSQGFRPMPIVTEVDLYKFDPWELPEQAAFGEKEWYFFSPRDRKYPNGVRPNRAAASGYWKATGTDKIIHSSADGRKIGVKKALVFYKGRAPKGVKSNWIMHEYRLVDAHHKALTTRKKGSLRLDDWVLCRIYKKKAKSYSRPANKIMMESVIRRNMLGGTMMEEDILAALPEIEEHQSSRMMQAPSSGDPFVQALLGNQQLRNSLPGMSSLLPLELQLLRNRDMLLFPNPDSGPAPNSSKDDNGLWHISSLANSKEQQQQDCNGLGLLENLQRHQQAVNIHQHQQQQQQLVLHNGEVVDDTFGTSAGRNELEFCNNTFNLQSGAY